MGNIMRRLCLGDAADAVEMSAIESVPTIAGKPAENKKGIMMVDITVKNILEATGGVLLCGDENTVLTDICINSKEAKEGDLFVPIIGSRTDGHRFIESALQVAAATLTSEHDNVVVSDKAYIRVDDTVKALQAIGKYIRYACCGSHRKCRQDNYQRDDHSGGERRNEVFPHRGQLQFSIRRAYHGVEND